MTVSLAGVILALVLLARATMVCWVRTRKTLTVAVRVCLVIVLMGCRIIMRQAWTAGVRARTVKK